MTVPSINFGTYSGSQLTQTGTINVTCTNGAAYWISLNAGLGTGATVTTRIMNAGSATLHYSLYRDSGYSLVWGITQGTNTVSGTGTGSQQNITVYAMMPASQPLTVGSYSDTVTATINY
jgi:spore coat protein U-like protein